MTEFVSLGTVAEVSPSTMRVFEHSGREIVIANLGGDYFAIRNKCICVAHFAARVEGETDDSHYHVGDFGHLIEGELTGYTVSCPLHTTVLDVKTGGPLKGPGEIQLSTFEVTLDGDSLSVVVMADSERHFWNDPGGAARP